MQAVWDWKAHFFEIKDRDVFDCYVAETLLLNGRYNPTEEQSLKNYHAKTLDELSEKQKTKFASFPKLEKLYFTIELPLVPVLAEMEKQGVLLDTKKLEKIGEEIVLARQKIEDEIRSQIGYEMNLNSSQQVGEYLAEKEGVPLGRTKTGKYATNETELLKFQAQFSIIQQLLAYRGLAKLHSTYVQSLIGKVDKESRIHTTYHQVFINTGRLASSNPNLQNIPVTSDFGVQIKSCFKPSPGAALVSFDYSQQELRILAHLSGEEKLITAFKEKQDVHSLTASQIFNVAPTEVTKIQRRIGKTINFGIIYGMSSFGLSESLQIPVPDAELFIKEFYTTFPKIKTYYDTYLQQAKERGFVETMMGRRRYVFEDPTRRFIDNGTRRVLMNYPMQGSAADLIKLAMVKISDELLRLEKDIHLILQIHDDLVFEIPDGDKKRLSNIAAKVRSLMCDVYPLTVPLEVDIKIGKNWGDMTIFSEE